MAKILVADDNSNIQKMVVLALKDQGIDVVAVGNGEAAVRKISDIHPDLVLADVFMPVRNGYEVCQYVKTDPKLSHIPVILLVGAFDPLDEQEAQRVGADGVLKKPFVPPDPLISMVKSALARAGVPLSGTSQGSSAELPPLQAVEMLTPRSLPGSKTLGDITPSPLNGDVPTVESEPVQDGIPSRPEPVKIDAGSQPLAFGNLLESPTTEEDLSYIHPVQSELAADRDWRGSGKEEEIEEEEEENATSSWRRDAGDEAFVTEESSGAGKEWKEPAFAESPGRKHHAGAWAPDKEKTGFVEAAEADGNVAARTETAVADPTVAAPAAPFSGDAWTAAIAPSSNQKAAVTEMAAVEAATLEARETAPAEPAAQGPASKPEISTAGSWFSSVASPWDTEAQKASQLASTWDAPPVSAPVTSEAKHEVTTPATTFVHKEAATAVSVIEKSGEGGSHEAAGHAAPPQKVSDAEIAHIAKAALPAATVEAIREEAAHLAERAIQETPAVPVGQGPQKAAEPSMDDVVAKVLAKMSPEMLQAVTREILKPVIESIVRDELSAKKQ